MTEIKTKKYDLEERTFEFTKKTIEFINKLPKTISNNEIAKQLMRSSGSVGANYIEANESLGKKDFILHIRISRKEAKETIYWLKLLNSGADDLIQEATELMKIFGAILGKSQ